MLISLKIFSLVFSIFVLIKMVMSVKQFHSIVPIIIVFDFVMVVPIYLELLWGNPETAYDNFILAMNDDTTNVLFYIFIVITQVAFLGEIIKIAKVDKNIINEQIPVKKNSFELLTNNKYKNILLIISYLVPIITILAIILSPSPTYYFHLFDSVYGGVNPNILQYNKLMRNLVYALLLALVINKWYDNDDKLYNRLIRIIYVALIMFSNHKRTFMMIAIGACLVIDIVKGKKARKIMPWYTAYIFFAGFYFVYYAYATGKISYNNDWYYLTNEYFFRTMHMKFAIYASLHPTNIHILDYPGESILFDLFYFIPRSLWASKPWPYVNYFISGVLGYSSYSSNSWGMPTSYYPEFVSNFGICGILISVIFTIWISRFLDRRNTVCKMLGVTLICLLEVYYYDNALKVLAAIVFILYLSEKKSFKYLFKVRNNYVKN